MAQSCQILDPGVEAEKPEWSPPLSRKKMLKESDLHHIIYCVCPLCSQHSEISENVVKSGSLVTLNRLFFVDVRSEDFREIREVEELSGASRSSKK